MTDRSFSYFIVMIDYGKRGMEAVVKVENTRRQIIEEVRDVIGSDDRSLVHVKFIDGNYCVDVSDEIVEEAKQQALEDA